MIAAATLLLTFLAGGAQPANVEAEHPSQIAMRVYLRCFVRHARELDDGISDAATIGRAMASQCEEERYALARAMTASGGPPDAETTALLVLRRGASEFATDVVLRLRAAQRRRP